MIRPVMGPRWMPLVVWPVARRTPSQTGYRADDGIAVRTQGAGTGKLLDQLGTLQVGQDIDCALHEFHPGTCGGPAIELLA